MDELVGEREHLLDDLLDGPHAIDLLAHLNELLLTIACFKRCFLLSLQTLDVFHEVLSFVDELCHAFLHAIPVWIVDQFEEDVEDAPFDLLAVAIRVQDVPQLEQELFLPRLPFLFLNLNRARFRSPRPLPTFPSFDIATLLLRLS